MCYFPNWDSSSDITTNPHLSRYMHLLVSTIPCHPYSAISWSGKQSIWLEASLYEEPIKYVYYCISLKISECPNERWQWNLTYLFKQRLVHKSYWYIPLISSFCCLFSIFKFHWSVFLTDFPVIYRYHSSWPGISQPCYLVGSRIQVNIETMTTEDDNNLTNTPFAHFKLDCKIIYVFTHFYSSYSPLKQTKGYLSCKCQWKLHIYFSHNLYKILML